MLELKKSQYFLDSLKYKLIIPAVAASFGLLFFVPQKAQADIFTGLEIDNTMQSASTPTKTEENKDNETELSSISLEAEKPSAEEGLVGPVYMIIEPKDAIELQRLYLDAATIVKGYTVNTQAGDFKAGVLPASVAVPVTVVLKQIPAWHMPVEQTAKKVSYIYEYDIRQCKNQKSKCKIKEDFFNDSGSLGELEQEIVIAIKFVSDNYNKKVVHYWDKPAQTWVPLESRTDFEENLVRAKIQFPYARIAVFEDIAVQEGPASWYAFRDCHCAASHIYTRGTKLLVTNIDPVSAKQGTSLVVTVNDYGPDPRIHPDRPIDLDKHAFEYLAVSLGSGLLKVRVEPVDPSLAEQYEWVDLELGQIAQR